LTTEQLTEIGQALRQPPREVGLCGNLWDGKALAAWVGQTFAIDVGVRQCQRLFRQLGFRLRKPRPQLAHADPERQKTHK
jgi:transposase